MMPFKSCLHTKGKEKEEKVFLHSVCVSSVCVIYLLKAYIAPAPSNAQLGYYFGHRQQNTAVSGNSSAARFLFQHENNNKKQLKPLICPLPSH